MTLTAEQKTLIREICGWLLDQDHDDISGEYLWFLTPNQELDPANEEELDHVRELLRGIVDGGAT